MTNKTLTIGLVITFVIAILGIFSPVGQGVINQLGTAATSCANNVTCYTNLAATGTFEVDGTTTLNGVVTNASSLAVTGDITTAAQLGVGTTSPATQDVIVDGTATTTLGIFSSGSGKGGCIQFKGTTGASYAVYVGAAGTLVTAAGVCK